ncbi:MAG: choice-of-anchor J domain-containing protein [Muribaculaceae bacterium]|nr:choice-of-anchor J domain-containing protein [Muribaculaceae bacterium]MBR5686001.1 choice-of-anchor J domain-containing protein [Muribaculaceae bacterium]
MKRFNYYLSLMLLLVFTAACNDEFDQPPMVIPTAEHTPNMTIAEFKAKYWQDAVNYIDTVKEDIVIHGWVTSSDESGNIYKSLYISDGTAGINISINQNSLYNNYRLGQEIVIPMKDYFVGKYNGQQQLGYPAWYASGSVWEATFLPQAMWESMVELNGLPNLSKVDTVDVSISDFQGKTDSETLLKYQGKLVRISGVHFTDANGVLTFAESSATTNRTIADEDGNQLIVRNSNYADFRADVLPEGDVDVVGLLSFYATRQNSSGTWQFYLRSADDVIGGGGKGTRSNPYTTLEAVAEQNTGAKGWVTGYIVGAVAPEVTTVSGNADIEWKAPTTLDNTIVIADDPNCTDVNKCLIIPLAQGSKAREELSLKNYPALYKKEIKVKGPFGTFMGKAGLTELQDYERPEIPVLKLEETFDTALPESWFNVTVSGDKAWYQTVFSSTGNGYAAMTGYKGNNPPFDAWLITPYLDIQNAASKTLSFRTQVAGYGSTTSVFEVYLLNSRNPEEATVKVKLNPALATPTNGTPVYSDWKESGEVDLSQWADGCYYIGFRFYATQDANYATWCVDDVTFGIAPKPDTSSDFETMPARTTTLGNYTSAKGWEANNCTLLEGGATDGNPVFAFIGYALGSTSVYAKAPTMNGGTASVGTIKSPVLKGGMTKLRFSYGCAYSGKVLKFRVDVKQNGNVVKSWTVSNDNVTQKQAYSFEEAVSVNGDFTVEFTNLCPSNATGNTKDRVSIWNVNWDAAE